MKDIENDGALNALIITELMADRHSTEVIERGGRPEYAEDIGNRALRYYERLREGAGSFELRDAVLRFGIRVAESWRRTKVSARFADDPRAYDFEILPELIDTLARLHFEWLNVTDTEIDEAWEMVAPKRRPFEVTSGRTCIGSEVIYASCEAEARDKARRKYGNKRNIISVKPA